MAPKPRAVTNQAIHTLLARIGASLTGKKVVLHARLVRDLCRSRLFAARPDSTARLANNIDPKHQTLKIMSIDMGIKNLAYCRAEVTYPDGSVLKPKMEVRTWERLDLIDATQQLRLTEPIVDDKKKPDPFSLRELSETAHRFLRDAALQSPTEQA